METKRRKKGQESVCAMSRSRLLKEVVPKTGNGLQNTHFSYKQSLGSISKSRETMACPLHAPLLLLTTLMVAVNLSLNPVLGNILLGGIEESSMQEEGAPEALEYAVGKYNENNNDLYLSHVVEVKRVRKQVVAGENFLFDVVLGQTTCTKAQDDLTNCPLNDQAEVGEVFFYDFVEYVFCTFELNFYTFFYSYDS
ncbi:cystatin-S-like protein [Cricetulus griseus]|uniref:Cystatin-S-like protein n=2 Tax=Cricetulus griseus TaxID=10029 RepID=A0A061I4K2_CRIGR|nr:cystatin-S-like protein [Cricetulus griseus]